MNEFSYSPRTYTTNSLSDAMCRPPRRSVFPAQSARWKMEGLCDGSQHQTAKAPSIERWVHHTIRPWPDCLGGYREICRSEAGRKDRPFAVCSSSFVPRHNTRQITNLFPSLTLNQAQPWFRQLVAIMTSKFQTFLCFSSMISFRPAIWISFSYGEGWTASHLAESPRRREARLALRSAAAENVRISAKFVPNVSW